MKRLNSILIIALLGISSFTVFNYAYAVDNNCGISSWTLFELPPILGCVDDRLDVLENNPTSPSALNDLTDVVIVSASNGEVLKYNGTFWTDGTDLTAGGGITHLDNLTDVVIFNPTTNQIISYNGSHWKNINHVIWENNTASNLGMASSLSEGIFSAKVGIDLQFKKLLEVSGISLSSNSTHIAITNTAPESTVCGSVGIGVRICPNAPTNISLRTLLSGNGISITNSSNDITITNTLPDNTVCANVGSGKQVYKDAECNFRTLVGSSDISITNTTNTVVIDYNGSSGSAPQIGQQAGDVYLSLTKTNIGNAYVDIYVTAFDIENLMVIDCANVTYGKVVYIWDYVGTGTQQLRWANVANNTQVFYESPTFTTDRDGIDSGFFVKPSWCIGTVTIEEQGKSTIAGDDPIAKGYKIMVK